MLNMNYAEDNTVYPIEFNVVSANVVELKGDFPILTDGFLLSRFGYEDNWDYTAYTTVYREIDGGVQFSNDGSIYVEPEPEFNLYKPTPEEIAEQEQKRLETEAVPTNAELSAAVMELAESISDIEDAITELGEMIS